MSGKPDIDMDLFEDEDLGIEDDTDDDEFLLVKPESVSGNPDEETEWAESVADDAAEATRLSAELAALEAEADDPDSNTLESEKPRRRKKDEGPPIPIKSGHCAYPQTAEPMESHDRCARNGSGNRANPAKIFHPCPCWCHFDGERYDCECGGTIVVAPYLGLDADGDDQYVHINPRTGDMVSELCS